MQTNKIKVGDTYAVRVGGELARYRVLATNTKRNMSGTSTTIDGELVDAVAGHPAGYKCSFEPANLIGDYKEQAELAAKEKQQRDAAELAAKQRTDRAEAIFVAFCKLVGVPKPEKVKERYDGIPRYARDEPFRLDYYNTIEINKNGMEILAKFLKVDQPREESTDNVVNLNKS
jgi:hypothetical protein